MISRFAGARVGLGLWLGLCLAACGSSSSPPPPAAGSDAIAIVPLQPPKPKHVDAAPRPQPELVVTRDGKPVPMTGALAWRTGNDNIKLLISSQPLGCDDVRDGMRVIRDGELSYDLALGPILQPDGTFAMTLKDISADGTTLQKPTKVSVTGTGSAGEATTAELDFSSADSALDGTGSPRPGSAAEWQRGSIDGHPYTLKGTIDALGCPSPPAKPAPPLPAEMPATLTVAGHTLPIRGARISKSAMPDLELTTGGEACDSQPGRLDSDFSLTLSWFDPKKPLGQLSLMGEKIGRQVADQTFDQKKVAISPLPLAPGEITLAIDVLVEGYPVKVTGKVMADVCKDSIHVTLP